MTSKSMAQAAPALRGHLTYTSPNGEPVRYTVMNVAARAFNGTVTDFSFNQLDDPKHCALLTANLPSDGPSTYFGPTLERMSGVVLLHNRFTVARSLGSGLQVRFPGYEQGSKTLCEGTNPPPGTGFLTAGGGCSLGVLTAGGRFGPVLVAFHVGRDSLLDMSLIRRGVPSRAHFSVVDAAVRFAKKLGAQPKDMIFRTFFSLPPNSHLHTFTDPMWGQVNQAVHDFLVKRDRAGPFPAYAQAEKPAQTVDELAKRHGLAAAFFEGEHGRCLSIPGLAARIARQLGVGWVEPDLLPLPENGDHAYTTHGDPQMRSVRNLTWLARHLT